MAGATALNPAAPRTDVRGMLLPFTPTSNAERQRQFMARNPGYYRKYNARRRGDPEQRRQAMAAMLQAAQAAEAAAVPPPVRALPAPGEQLILPGLEAFAAAPAPAPLPARDAVKIAA
jgi:hypothetical protein